MSRSKAVHQFLPTLAPRDAVGNHTLETHRALKRAGIRCGIWVEEVFPELGRLARGYEEFEKRSQRFGGNPLFLYQASTGSKGMVDFLLGREGPMTLCYHNITPPEFFEPYEPAAALLLARGREELRRLADRVKVATADSEFNAEELRQLGCPDVRVIPPYLPPSLGQADPALAEELRSDAISILFVGRCAPNKNHPALLEVLAAIRSGVTDRAKLYLVGSQGPSSYMELLARMIDRLALENHVEFVESVSESHLAAYYSASSIYLSMSKHEGFGLPLIESMRYGLPVVALDAGAVSETLGGAGVILHDEDPGFVAEVLWRVCSDSGLREQLVASQERRAREVVGYPRDEQVLAAVLDAATT